ncbi:MAG: T9SS type A sorting domain-containing protein [Ignavibacteria bacterium]|nr:T9SS type A sorting domain-containing protein [Ignavibacteria bacterium]
MKSLIKIFSFLLFLTPLFPQHLYEEQIIPFDGRENDFFGTAVAVSDSFLFVSSLRYSNTVENAVYVYRWRGNNIEFAYKIHPSDGQPGVSGLLFGRKLLYSDGQLFVGARYRKVNNIPVGAVYLFEYENYVWVEKQIIIPPEPHTINGFFSNSISKYNDNLLIGADCYNSGNYRSGKVFLYKFTNGNYELYQEFAPFDGKDYQFCGTSVEIKENIILIGSENDNTGSGLGSGSVYVYTKEDLIWTFSRKYLPEENSENLAYGSSMALNDDYVFVGTTDNPFYFKPGKVYIYNYSEAVLDLAQIIETGDNYYDDRFGIQLYAKGDSLLVSALFDSVKNDYPGAAYLFVYKEGEWRRRHKIFPSDEQDAHWFSLRCALSDNLIVVGAPVSKYNGIFTGKIYLYTSSPVSVIEEDVFEVKGFYLSQNYPNPFNPTTKIRYSLPGSEIVQIKVFDVLGKEIKTLLNEYKQTGTYEIEFDASNLTSGVYFYQLSAGIFVETKKMILLR